MDGLECCKLCYMQSVLACKPTNEYCLLDEKLPLVVAILAAAPDSICERKLATAWYKAGFYLLLGICDITTAMTKGRCSTLYLITDQNQRYLAQGHANAKWVMTCPAKPATLL